MEKSNRTKCLSPEKDSRHRKLKSIMQYIHTNIANPPALQRMQFEGGNCFASVSDFTSVPKQRSSLSSIVGSYPSVRSAAQTSQNTLSDHGFILFFISQFHLQYAKWINKTHEHVSVWFDGAWRRTQCGTDRDLGPRHISLWRSEAIIHQAAPVSSAGPGRPPMPSTGHRRHALWNIHRLLERNAACRKKRLNESKHEWSDTWRLRMTEREKEKQPEAFVHRLFSTECWHWLIGDVRPAVHFLCLSLTPFYVQFTEDWGSFETVGVSWWVGGAQPTRRLP